MIPTGAVAEMRFEGARFGTCRDFKMRIAREALQDTTLSSWDETYIAGRRNSQATASLFYDPADAATANLLNAMREDSSDRHGFELVFDRVIGKSQQFDAVITQIEPGTAFGEAAVVPITLQISGKPEGVF